MFTRSDRLRPNTKFSRLSGTESDKSFVDDFDMERGIVRMRVGLSYDLLRLSLLFRRFVNKHANCANILEIKYYAHPTKQTHTYNYNTIYNTKQTRPIKGQQINFINCIVSNKLNYLYIYKYVLHKKNNIKNPIIFLSYMLKMKCKYI